jgi:hypothetical protein
VTESHPRFHGLDRALFVRDVTNLFLMESHRTEGEGVLARQFYVSQMSAFKYIEEDVY